MTESVIIAALGVLGTISTAVSGVLVALIARQRKQARAMHATVERVRDQVENDHGTNMRDDLDVLRDQLGGISQAVSGVASDIRGIRADIGRLDRRDIEDGVARRELAQKLDKHVEWAHEQEDRIDNLEDTLNPTKENP